MVLLRKKVDPAQSMRLARELAGRLTGFEPQAVVYVRRGGEAPGLAIADELSLPACEIDIRYPLSRLLELTPRALRPALLVVKEIAYRAARPRAADESRLRLPDAGTRVVLVDDSASSGRTVRAALASLEAHGIPRSAVRVVVVRCGRRARPLVDAYALAEPVLFTR